MAGKDARKGANHGTKGLFSPRAGGVGHLRVRQIMTIATVFLFFGLTVVLVYSLIVNNMKNRLVEEARIDARRRAEDTTEIIRQILSRNQATSLDQIVNDRVLRAHLRIMTRDGGVVLAALMDSQGEVIYQQFGEEVTVRPAPRTLSDPDNPRSILSGFIPGGEGLMWEMQVGDYPADVSAESIPIICEETGTMVGQLQYGVSDTQIASLLGPISSQISRSLVWMVLLVLACFGLALYLFHLVGDRHTKLLRRHDEAQHFAHIGTLASGMAHEVRNPLHAMNLQIDAACEELEDPREDSPQHLRRLLGNVQRQIESLNAILTNFMSYALPKELELEPVRLSNVLSEVSNVLELEFQSRQIAFQVHVPGEAWIMADPTAVRQVLMNVLINALQILEDWEETREIHVTARGNEDTWMLVVEDTGPGLPEGKEEEIFQVFQSHRRGGTGFGLAIARRVMEQQGGAIFGETKSEGGARFTLKFKRTSHPSPAGGVRRPDAQEQHVLAGRS